MSIEEENLVTLKHKKFSAKLKYILRNTSQFLDETLLNPERKQ